VVDLKHALIIAVRLLSEFRSINHIKIIYLPIILMNLEFVHRQPDDVTNFRCGSLCAIGNVNSIAVTAPNVEPIQQTLSVFADPQGRPPHGAFL
jgi:hypothetical protein